MDIYREMMDGDTIGLPPQNLPATLARATLWDCAEDGSFTSWRRLGSDHGFTSVIHGLTGEGFEDDAEVLATSRIVVETLNMADYYDLRSEYFADPAATVQRLREAGL